MDKKIIFMLIVLLLSGLALMPASAEQGKAPMTLKQAMDLDRHDKSHEAIEAIKQIIAQDPSQDKSKAYFNLGLVYFRSGDFENALSGGFLKAVEIKKEIPSAYYFMGMIYEKKALSTPKADMARDMKARALESWKNYLKYAGDKKIIDGDKHHNIGISIQESIKRAKNHVEMLQEGLQ